MSRRKSDNLLDAALVLTIFCSLQNAINGDFNNASASKVLTVNEVTPTEIRLNDSLLYSNHGSSKANLLKYFVNISRSNKTISGVDVSYGDYYRHEGLETLRKIAGVFPRILTTRSPPYNASEAKWQEFIAGTISDWNNGHFVIIRLTLIDNPPASKIISEEGNNETSWTDLITEGTNLNNAWKKELDALVPYLLQLQNAGVVPICNLIPCINDDDTFWNGRPGWNGSLKLYQITFDYLTQHHNLTSLIRVWSINANRDMKQLAKYWPGINYVDHVSVRMYQVQQLNMIDYQNLLNVVGVKPISMDYMWTVPPPRLWDKQTYWVWFTVTDDYLGDIKQNSEEEIRMGFNGPSVVNRENIDFFSNNKVWIKFTMNLINDDKYELQVFLINNFDCCN